MPRNKLLIFGLLTKKIGGLDLHNGVVVLFTKFFPIFNVSDLIREIFP